MIFGTKRKYITGFSKIELRARIASWLPDKKGMFNGYKIEGSVTDTGFRLLLYTGGTFPARVRAVEIPGVDDQWEITFKPWINPLYFIIPLYALCILGMFVDDVAFRGVPVNFPTQALLLLGTAAWVTLFFAKPMVNSVVDAREFLEEELELTEV